MNSASRDRYTVLGNTIAYTLEGAADWAEANKATWNVNHIWWERDDDVEATDVDSDVADILINRGENAKTPDQVNAEALALLNQKIDRLMFEASARIEALERKVSELTP